MVDLYRGCFAPQQLSQAKPLQNLQVHTGTLLSDIHNSLKHSVSSHNAVGLACADRAGMLSGYIYM
jgi:hypothetical protein